MCFKVQNGIYHLHSRYCFELPVSKVWGESSPHPVDPTEMRRGTLRKSTKTPTETLDGSTPSSDLQRTNLVVTTGTKLLVLPNLLQVPGRPLTSFFSAPILQSRRSASRDTGPFLTHYPKPATLPRNGQDALLRKIRRLATPVFPPPPSPSFNSMHLPTF